MDGFCFLTLRYSKFKKNYKKVSFLNVSSFLLTLFAVEYQQRERRDFDVYRWPMCETVTPTHSAGNTGCCRYMSVASSLFGLKPG